MARHHGRYGKVYINGTAVISVDSWKLSMSRDKAEVTCFGDVNKVKVMGLPEFKGSWTGFWDDTDTTFWSVIASPYSYYLTLYTDYENNIGSFAYGPAWIDISLDTSVKDAVKVSGDFEAAGTWVNTFGG